MTMMMMTMVTLSMMVKVVVTTRTMLAHRLMLFFILNYQNLYLNVLQTSHSTRSWVKMIVVSTRTSSVSSAVSTTAANSPRCWNGTTCAFGISQEGGTWQARKSMVSSQPPYQSKLKWRWMAHIFRVNYLTILRTSFKDVKHQQFWSDVSPLMISD